MTPDIILLILIFIPLSFFIGFGASAIGLTAWPLMVPLLFVFFGFDLYLTIFISLLVDLGNAVIKTVNAVRKGQIHARLGLKLALFACLCIIPGIWAGTYFIPQHTDFFRESVGLFNMIFAFGFLIRGFKAKRKAEKRPGNPAPEKMPAPYRKYFIWPGIAFVAVQTGLFGIGGGMMYAICMIALLGFPTMKATGTAMLITCCSVVFASAGIFMQIPDPHQINTSMLILIFLFVGISIIGTIAGEKITYRLPEARINFLISGVITAASILATAQGLLIQ